MSHATKQARLMWNQHWTVHMGNIMWANKYHTPSSDWRWLKRTVVVSGALIHDGYNDLSLLFRFIQLCALDVLNVWMLQDIQNMPYICFEWRPVCLHRELWHIFEEALMPKQPNSYSAPSQVTHAEVLSSATPMLWLSLVIEVYLVMVRKERFVTV